MLPAADCQILTARRAEQCRAAGASHRNRSRERRSAGGEDAVVRQRPAERTAEAQRRRRGSERLSVSQCREAGGSQGSSVDGHVAAEYVRGVQHQIAGTGFNQTVDAGLIGDDGGDRKFRGDIRIVGDRESGVASDDIVETNFPADRCPDAVVAGDISDAAAAAAVVDDELAAAGGDRAAASPKIERPELFWIVALPPPRLNVPVR